MGFIETRDSVIWAKGVHGDDELRDRILQAPSGTIMELEFAEFGFTCTFVKMDDGPNGATNGIKPADKKLWRSVQVKKAGSPTEVRLLKSQMSSLHQQTTAMNLSLAGISDPANNAPWASGPGEILRHGLELLRVDSDRNRRLAIISIDNAVELMMKTFLGLPKRINGLSLSRKDYDEFAESFPKLLDALEKYATDRIVGIDLGNVEWYHRLRNQLYHEGNGLTVERDKVAVYASLAKVLFKNLFGFDLGDPTDPSISAGAASNRLGQFLELWITLERRLVKRLESTQPTQSAPKMPTHDLVAYLFKLGQISNDERSSLELLRELRNDAVHGGDLSGLEEEAIIELRKLLTSLERRWAG